MTSLLLKIQRLHHSASILKRSEEWLPTMCGCRYMVNTISFTESAKSRKGRTFQSAIRGFLHWQNFAGDGLIKRSEFIR